VMQQHLHTRLEQPYVQLSDINVIATHNIFRSFTASSTCHA
jgi:hypothetical protein